MAAKEAKKDDKPPVKLWAPDHPTGCHIGLTNGTTFMVPHDEDGIEVPKEFVKAALQEGCVPVGMGKEDVADEAFDRAKLIRSKMEEMYKSDDPSNFGRNDGKPVLTKLSALCGFQVERAERDEEWAKVQASLEGKGEDA